MADVIAVPKASNVVGYIVGALLLGGIAFAIFYGAQKGKQAATK